MKDRSREDFSDVITDLQLTNADIVPVPKKFTNAAGVHHNPKAKEGFQYVAAFATRDKTGHVWVETFCVEKDGTKMVINGRCGSKHMGSTNPSKAEVAKQASEMIDQWLHPV